MPNLAILKDDEVAVTQTAHTQEDPSLELQKANPNNGEPSTKKPWLFQKGHKPTNGFQPGNGGPIAVHNEARNSKPISSKVRQFLQLPYEGPNRRYKARGFTFADALAANLIKQAEAGDMRSFELLIDRTEGKLTTTIAPGGAAVDTNSMTPEEKRARVAELLGLTQGE
jgi:hypothetical protein